VKWQRNSGDITDKLMVYCLFIGASFLFVLQVFSTKTIAAPGNAVPRKSLIKLRWSLQLHFESCIRGPNVSLSLFKFSLANTIP
jgi:hypothetical protein